MKNIHILPTDKPSRLCLSNNSILTIIEEANYTFSHIQSVNIYITSDEEIKEGDWFITDDKRIEKCAFDWKARDWHKKIILTDNKDLIKDGVQAIDDEVLEWFVKNPNCEYVETKVEFIQTPDNLKDGFYYKIIIPKEEPKQEYQSECICDTECRGFVNVKCKKPKPETLEEAAERYARKQCDDMYDDEGLTGANWGWEIALDFKEGAKWQQEQDVKKIKPNPLLMDEVGHWDFRRQRSYSEEEVRKAQQAILGNLKDALQDENYIIEFLEQFKKK